jgi:hypothetical protein
VSVANALIAHNVDRESRQLTPVAVNELGEMWIRQLADVAREADIVAAFIDQQINTHGRKPQIVPLPVEIGAAGTIV